MPYHRHIGWVAAMAVVVLTGCSEGKENHPAATARPEKIVLTERSEDLRSLIDGKLAAGNKRIVIPQGRYRVQAKRGDHLVFRNLSDVEIIADNVELVCTSTVRALMFEDCSNVRIRGLVVDYDPLPFTQGGIIAMAPDKSWMDFEVAKGYPANELEERIQIYDPATGGLRRGDASWNEQIEALGGNRYRVRKSANYRFNPDRDTEQVGDILVTNHKSGAPGSPHTVELRACKSMRFEVPQLGSDLAERRAAFHDSGPRWVETPKKAASVKMRGQSALSAALTASKSGRSFG